VFVLLAASGCVRAAIPPKGTAEKYSKCLTLCNQQFKDCVHKCEAVKLEVICKRVYMECIHNCDDKYLKPQ